MKMLLGPHQVMRKICSFELLEIAVFLITLVARALVVGKCHDRCCRSRKGQESVDSLPVAVAAAKWRSATRAVRRGSVGDHLRRLGTLRQGAAGAHAGVHPGLPIGALLL